ncbi:MAG: disulfide bond formation protein B [Arhodomonas sp.]|nr:disulfide bond formation protein B [Arhodomonas sp.]
MLLLAGLHAPRSAAARVYAVLAVVVSAIGVALSWRHLWLQSLPPDQVPACGPGLGYMMDTLPLMDVLERVLSGSGECAEVDRVLGVSIPAWTLLAFVVAAVAAVAVNWPARRR